MKRLFIVRHGETDWNADRRLQGHANIPLSERGRLQAEALRPTIHALSPDRVVTSSLARARDTAALLGYPDAESRDELREIHVGKWTGELTRALIDRKPAAYYAWRAGSYTPSGAETWSEFRDRAVSFVQDLVASPHRRILLVTHSGVLRAVLESLLALAPDRIVSVGPGSLTVVRHELSNGQQAAKLEVFNFSPAGPLLDSPY
jgi:probable phosphoglycerate mutase